MKVGFTGTRHGMSEAQKDELVALLLSLKATEIHHGDCVGADDEAANAAYDYTSVRIICHPPIDTAHRAYNDTHHETREPKTHFARNRDIVDQTDCLIAAPLTDEPQERGGTWYTINYAKKQGKPVHQLKR